MKQLIERNENFSVEPLSEAVEPGKEPEYYLEGVFIQCNRKNRNGRIYPMSVVEPEVERYKREYVDRNRGFGVLNHPVDGNPSIDLKEVSHMITKIWRDGDFFKCRAKILDTPNGRIVKAMIKEGCQLGVSTRALGSVTMKEGINYVNDDFHLITAGDIVFEPSAQTAFPVGLMESIEWDYSVDPVTGEETYKQKEAVKTVSEEQRTAIQLEEFKNILKSLEP